MAYEGEVLNTCGVVQLDLRQIEVVAVSGSVPNFCDHLLLFVPSRGGYYFQVAGIYQYPHYMTEGGFRRYLKENGKRVLRRRPLKLPDPRGAHTYLENIISERWIWGVLPHNCVSFVEGVIQAGGGSWASYTNCPSIATADTIHERIDRFLIELEIEFRNQMGFPH